MYLKADLFLLRAREGEHSFCAVFAFQRDQAEVVLLTLFRSDVWKRRPRLLGRWLASPSLWRHGPMWWHVPLARSRTRQTA